VGDGRFIKGNIPWSKGKTKKDCPNLSGGRKPGPQYAARLDVSAEDVLGALSETRNYKLAAKRLGCTRASLRNILRREGCELPKYPRTRNVWTPERIEKLREIYPTMPTKEVAEYFETTVVNIGRQAKVFGIDKKIRSDSTRTATHKRCADCGEWKLFDEFYPKASGYSRSMCKECDYEHQKDYTRRHPEMKRKWERSYYQNHSDALIRKSVEYNRLHPKEARARRKKWAESHPVRAALIASNNAHRRRNASRDTDITTAYLKTLKQKTNVCPYCGEPIGTWNLDHMQPISKGGLHMMGNVIYCCRDCNAKKHMQTAEEFCGMTPRQLLKKAGVV